MSYEVKRTSSRKIPFVLKVVYNLIERPLHFQRPEGFDRDDEIFTKGNSINT